VLSNKKEEKRIKPKTKEKTLFYVSTESIELNKIEIFYYLDYTHHGLLNLF
jgi:hypothetical protein